MQRGSGVMVRHFLLARSFSCGYEGPSLTGSHLHKAGVNISGGLYSAIVRHNVGTET